MRTIRRIASAGAIDPDERVLAGHVCGWLFALGGLTLTTIPLLPGHAPVDLPWLLTVAAAAVIWGCLQRFLIDWRRAPVWLIHASLLFSLVLVFGAVASSGGPRSSAWVYLFFVVLYTSYFFPRRFAYFYLGASAVVHALPLLYGSRIGSTSFLSQYAIAAPAYLVFGLAILGGKDLMVSLRRKAVALAELQGALRRIATAAVGGEPAERIYELVAQEVVAMHRGVAAGILRLHGEDTVEVMGAWPEQPGGQYRPGTIVPVPPGSDVARILQTGEPVREPDSPQGTRLRALGYRSSVVAPVKVDGRIWGVLALTGHERNGLDDEDERKLSEFGDLLATAIASIEDRAKLAAQAISDPLTGLPNHRALQERLHAEVSRAVRHGLPLALAVVDVDQFKLTNDIGGHEVGDSVLVKLAEALRGQAREEDVLGRIGGDEFAWVMPETGSARALAAVERVRAVVAREAPEPFRTTVSAGICDITVTQDPGELLRFADGALYWSKAHGRDQAWIYDAQVIDELSAQERAERLERTRALLGLRALARAIDAKDPATREHSERVSALAGKLARVAGWTPERVRLLTEAALVHDVGKIGVPDSVLRKVGPLTREEWQLIVPHAELSARIVEGVLVPEQVAWIRMHHERPDGRGYPAGLRQEQILDGAAMLAVADAFDVMTISRPYSSPKAVAEAVEEVRSLVGRQFAPAAAEALITLHAKGELEEVPEAVPAAGA